MRSDGDPRIPLSRYYPFDISNTHIIIQQRNIFKSNGNSCDMCRRFNFAGVNANDIPMATSGSARSLAKRIYILLLLSSL